jgi:hypothetical protein
MIVRKNFKTFRHNGLIWEAAFGRKENAAVEFIGY